MQTFQLRVSSRNIYLATILTITPAGAALGMALLPTKENPPVAIIMSAIVVGIAFYATRFTSRAMTEWKITESEIQLRWLEQFIFNNRADITISWSDIQHYKYEPDFYFELFELKLTDGTFVRLRHQSSTTDDDFKKFVKAFESQVLANNQKDTATSIGIKRSKTIYETKLGLILAVLTGLLLIAIPMLIAFLPNKSDANWGGFVFAYAGGLFFIIQVLAYRKKKSNS